MTETTAQPTEKGGFLKFVRDLLVIVIGALVLSVLLKTFLIRSFYIPSSSMEQTLLIDDRVMVNQLVPDVVPVQRGDVVVFKDPGGWLLGHPKPDLTPLQKALEFIGLQPETSGEYLIKRVIAVGGDRVACCTAEGKITVNGVAIDETYIQKPAGQTAASAVPFDVVVPENSYWVLGDNRYASQDSRFQTETPSKGFVPQENIVGRAFLLHWPLQRFGIIGNHPAVFDHLDNTGQ
ncbi:signal peptidase I [Leucobacter sp. OH2974_COT-288]|nr:signal peptidase I [Leucobacter sp. OH2974_COT-288]